MSAIVQAVEAITPANLTHEEGGDIGAMMPVQATPGLLAFGAGAAGGAGVVWLGVQAYEAGRQAAQG